MKILAIETSCDETAAAITENGRTVLSSVVATQIEEHKLYGGVVPEIASRRHSECIVQITEETLNGAALTLNNIDAVAVTYAPGLIGALLVGVNFAKGLALALGKPIIPVHHIKGHIAACYIENPELKPPFLCIVVSGGHSHIIEVLDYTEFRTIGRTLDDAAGEAFDKAARVMGFPYPGGVHIDREVAKHKPCHTLYKLPYPKTEREFDFSFSGLKTAVINLVHNTEQKGGEINRLSLAAAFQHTVCEILTEKFFAAARYTGHKTLVICGGVAANSYLRTMAEQKALHQNARLYIPSLRYCGDNAAMIGCQGFYEYKKGNTANSALNAVASISTD